MTSSKNCVATDSYFAHSALDFTQELFLASVPLVDDGELLRLSATTLELNYQ